MKKVKRLFFNTLILTGTFFVMRTIGMSFGVYLTNTIGAQGMGLYHLVLSVYMLACTLASSGVRLAATRLSVDSIAKGKSPAYVMRRCICYSLLTGTMAAVLLYKNAGFIAECWLYDAQTVLPLKILSASLPFFAMSSAMGGYFAAIRRAAAHSFIQVFEQLVKILVVVVSLPVLAARGPVYACASIAAGMTVSEIFTFTCLMTMFALDKTRKKGGGRERKILRGLFSIALPEAAGGVTRSILSTAENLLIPEGFRRGGASGDGALFVYGSIQAMVMPVIYFPTAVLTSLSGLLVPELAQCRAQNHTKNISYIIARVLRLSLIFSIAVMGIIYAFSEDISYALYQNNTAAVYLRILAPVIPIMYLDMVVDGMLKGLNLQFYSMCYNIIDSAMRVVLIFYLLPVYSVWGYIAVLYISEVLNFYLSFGKLSSLSYLKIHVFSGAGWPAACIALSVLVARMPFIKGALVLKILLAWLLYGILLFLTKTLNREDVRWFKSIFK